MNEKSNFDLTQIIRRRERAKRICARGRVKSEDHGFLHEEAAQIIGQRLGAINRDFLNPALLFDGPHSGALAEQLRRDVKNIKTDFEIVPFAQINSTKPVLPSSIDLAVSIFDLHFVGDLLKILTTINQALKPDGLFIAALPIAGTLEQLHRAMLAAESELSAAAAMRIDNFLTLQQLADLMHQADFRLVVGDTEKITISYGSLKKLLADLRANGASGVDGSTSITRPLPRRFLSLVETHYRQKSSDKNGKLLASINLAFLSGWRAHKNQQKPLRPGSAQKKLSDIL